MVDGWWLWDDYGMNMWLWDNSTLWDGWWDGYGMIMVNYGWWLMVMVDGYGWWCMVWTWWRSISEVHTTAIFFRCHRSAAVPAASLEVRANPLSSWLPRCQWLSKHLHLAWSGLEWLTNRQHRFYGLSWPKKWCVSYYASAFGFLTRNSKIWLRSIVLWLWLSSLNESEKSDSPCSSMFIHVPCFIELDDEKNYRKAPTIWW